MALLRFFRQLEQHDAALFEKVPEDLRQRYRKPSDTSEGCHSNVELAKAEASR